MSDTRKLTPAHAMPGRDLLRRATYEGPANSAAGGVKDPDGDAILAKVKQLFRKRSISKATPFGVDARKTLCLLLLLFAIPANACFAQTPPPPLDEHALERVPPTVAKRLATRFSLGAFAGGFEETRLGAVRDAVGEGTIQHQGDAGGSLYWLCYRRPQHLIWVVSGGEIGGPDHLVTEIVEEFTEKDTATSTDCAPLPDKFAPVAVDGKLHVGMSRQEVITGLGPPSKADGAQMVYSRAGKLKGGFDETAWLILRFRENKLVAMRGGKTTTN
ncbi:hypothetical protein G8O24_21015 [Bradyrhizobium sp. INPA01-394B]|uniref:Uncharacterized protein n=1 Tax=Bradyrhizobium campsiandrae TaxID=1729892 RepID=A0ABR7U4U9_9BRAD|nr:hypothetical protein [Bradyrhizobium campsiandrae]MBC9879824.1 hypothetical protein [Bradyrhizobium campsiandrae]MBC9978843.1 hypothetical protein [Bradyrhizobium campsiandrae]